MTASLIKLFFKVQPINKMSYKNKKATVVIVLKQIFVYSKIIPIENIIYIRTETEIFDKNFNNYFP